MLGLSSHPRLGLSTREIERRLRFLEEALERGSGRVSARTGDAADRLGEILAAALSSVAERFRGGAHLRGEAARLSGEAAKIGTDTLLPGAAERSSIRFGVDRLRRGILAREAWQGSEGPSGSNSATKRRVPLARMSVRSRS